MSQEIQATDVAPSQVPGDKLDRLVRELRKIPQVECPVRHHFSPGVYAREMFIPAGTVVVGKIHKHENMLVMSSGSARILVGGEVSNLTAPLICVSPPGTQRAVIAITDCVFISVHGTHKTDLAEIEAEFIAQDALEYEAFSQRVIQGV